MIKLVSLVTKDFLEKGKIYEGKKQSRLIDEYWNYMDDDTVDIHKDGYYVNVPFEVDSRTLRSFWFPINDFIPLIDFRDQRIDEIIN